jgi:DNA replication protein DnaC
MIDKKMILKTINDLSKDNISVYDKPFNFKIINAKETFIYVYKILLEKIEKRKFVFIPEYEQIINWLSDNNGKGLTLLGASGRGKSYIIRRVMPVIFRYNFNKNIKVISAYDITLDTKFPKIVAIDDIGTESLINNYGIKINKISEIIDKSEAEGKLILLSGNISPNDIINKYGEPIYDRLLNTTKIIKFSGQSFRRQYK